MKQIIRNITIDSIMGNPNPIIDTFYGIWKDLSVSELNVYHSSGGEFIYYNKDKHWIFYQDTKEKKFWCNHNHYWKKFSPEFKYDEIQYLTKFLIENITGTIIPNPTNVNIYYIIPIEKALYKHYDK